MEEANFLSPPHQSTNIPPVDQAADNGSRSLAGRITNFGISAHVAEKVPLAEKQKIKGYKRGIISHKLWYSTFVCQQNCNPYTTKLGGSYAGIECSDTLMVLIVGCVMGLSENSVARAWSTLAKYYRGLYLYGFCGADYDSGRHLFGDDVRGMVYVYSLVLMFRIWDLPHYRNGSFGDDLRKNLRNVAIPGTGIPLSLFALNKLFAWLFILLCVPVVYLTAAIYQVLFVESVPDSSWYNKFCSVLDNFSRELLHPSDWFSYWQLNCRLASWHAHVTASSDYKYESKWEFLKDGAALGIPVSPFFSDEKFSRIVVKDKNEEGGMGINFFTNASAGGDFIIQPYLDNAAEISSLLPKAAPLSTFRVITLSSSSFDENTEKCPVQALSCVWRAGRSNAATDHTSILFDVDAETGTIKKGTTNEHWYKLGLIAARTCPWFSFQDLTHHVDNSSFQLTGHVVLSNFRSRVVDLAVDAHRRLLPQVVMAGWDVAVTTEGVCLLEVNLSCNFFRGQFDEWLYFRKLDKCFSFLEGRRQIELEE